MTDRKTQRTETDIDIGTHATKTVTVTMIVNTGTANPATRTVLAEERTVTETQTDIATGTVTTDDGPGRETDGGHARPKIARRGHTDHDPETAVGHGRGTGRKGCRPRGHESNITRNLTENDGRESLRSNGIITKSQTDMKERTLMSETYAGKKLDKKVKRMAINV